MTWKERFENAGAAAKAAWWVLLIVALFFALLLLARACNGESEAKAALVRLQQNAQLREAGFLVAVDATQKVLDARAAEIPELQDEIARLKNAAPKVRIVRVERIVTAPAPAEGVPRPPPMPGEPCPQCLFAWGDTGQLRIDSVDLETREGNQVATVHGEAWRIDPAPETRILAGMGSAPVSTLTAELPPLQHSPGIGVGLAAGYGTSGPIGSAMIISPPFLWRHVELAAIVSAGEGVGVAGQGAIIYRP
jgi:hypothetical protein